MSFPRLVGTPGEGQAAATVIKTLKDLGYEVTEYPFPIARTPWGWMRTGLIIALIMLVSARMIAATSPLIAAFLSVLVLCGLPASGILWQRLARQGTAMTGASIHSANIVARRPGGRTAPPSLTLYVLAHYDSKSQTISLPTRIVLILVVGLGCLLFGGACLMAALRPGPGTGPTGLLTTATVPWAFSIVGASVLLAARTENRSPGGLDNAGSVGTLLALAAAFREAPLREVEVIFVSTGAEEFGLLGAYAFIRQWMPKMDRTQSWFLNLDGVGVKGTLRVTEGARPFAMPRSRFAGLIRRVAARDGIPIRSFPILPGLLLDHIPFSAQGLYATSLIGVSARTKHIHTERDTIALVDPDGLHEVGRLVEAVIQELAGFR